MFGIHRGVTLATFIQGDILRDVTYCNSALCHIYYKYKQPSEKNIVRQDLIIMTTGGVKTF